MFRPQLQVAKAARGVRFNSSSASKPSLVSRLVFYTRAVKEVGKEVYIQEGLAPPTLAQIKAAFNQIPTVAFKVAENPKLVSSFFSKLNSTELVKYTFYGVQLVGFFSLGEIIGRRSISGYENPKDY